MRKPPTDELKALVSREVNNAVTKALDKMTFEGYDFEVHRSPERPHEVTIWARSLRGGPRRLFVVQLRETI